MPIKHTDNLQKQEEDIRLHWREGEGGGQLHHGSTIMNFGFEVEEELGDGVRGIHIQVFLVGDLYGLVITHKGVSREKKDYIPKARCL